MKEKFITKIIEKCNSCLVLSELDTINYLCKQWTKEYKKESFQFTNCSEEEQIEFRDWVMSTKIPKLPEGYKPTKPFTPNPEDIIERCLIMPDGNKIRVTSKFDTKQSLYGDPGILTVSRINTSTNQIKCAIYSYWFDLNEIILIQY